MSVLCDAVLILHDDRFGAMHEKCELLAGHDGEHSITYAATEPVAQMRWSTSAPVVLPEVGSRFVWSAETDWGLHVYGPCEVNAVTPARVMPAAVGWHSTEGSCIAHSVDPAEFFAKFARALDGSPL